ncbi:conserved hypothetical protein [Candidatus Protochlamydia naegleriophila]|uniref:Uncharacterized protein n=1 Tax=Candidatus Protochlamydia naegleriophila TaxID=389348 RepID=A0A0U5JJP4_9BACT|nr:hypothetical protein [Candidatus Protochlamydia naegleriophila]CUI18022.1 conserved hypothetical protein [Candidatus Protochlamydia naegleriophila]
MDIAENNVVRFISVTKKKDGMFANFRVKGMKGGATFSSSISVDISQANVHAGDTLEKIIEECGRIAVRMFEIKLQFEGLLSV